MYQRVRRELSIWQRLNHENVVPLLGITSDFGRYMSLVSPWLDHGSLSHYLRQFQDTLGIIHRLQLVSPPYIIHNFTRFIIFLRLLKWHPACSTVSSIQVKALNSWLNHHLVHTLKVVHGDLYGVSFNLI
jgi:serine/threonine protein kinase